MSKFYYRVNEFQQKIEDLRKKFDGIEAVFGLEKKQEEIKKLEKKSGADDFWNEPQYAGKIMQELEETKKEIEALADIKKRLAGLLEMIKLIENEKDNSDIEKEIGEIDSILSSLEFKTLFSGDYDKNDAIISIYSGAGGVDAQDWSEMLLKMYLKWAENNNFIAKIASMTKGQEAGIKNATIEITGSYAYGHLRSEAGVHRLVRLSPFNSDNLRQTSFALVEIMPVIEDLAEVKINTQDIKVDTYRSSGAGGQSVNTTDSAVRVTHLPTKTVVTCQNERSQLQNKETAMKILRAKLHQKFLEKKGKEKAKLRGDQISAEWGSQIRSYVVHPYKMVKDHRTKYETSDVESVLNGNLSSFMENYLRHVKK
jgi:peptide chain release factor 2